jgi:hypothetical protein
MSLPLAIRVEVLFITTVHDSPVIRRQSNAICLELKCETRKILSSFDSWSIHTEGIRRDITWVWVPADMIPLSNKFQPEMFNSLRKTRSVVSFLPLMFLDFILFYSCSISWFILPYGILQRNVKFFPSRTGAIEKLS